MCMNEVVIVRSLTFVEEVWERIVNVMSYIAPPVSFALSNHEVEVAL